MKVSKEQKEEHRELLIEAAAKLFREQGIAAVTVGDIAQAAGLTHGALYSHFASKEKIAEAAVTSAFRASCNRIKRKRTELSWTLTEALSSYLSTEHLANRSGGCPAAALSTEIANLDIGPRRAFEKGLRDLIAAFATLCDNDPASRQQAIRALATGVGGLVMARAVKDFNFAREILTAANAGHGVEGVVPPAKRKSSSQRASRASLKRHRPTQ